MAAPANFPLWFHLIIMYPVILFLTITAGHTSDHDNPRFKLTPELRVFDLPPPSPTTHMNPKRDVPPPAPESPPPESPSAPPPPYSAYDTPPPETDIPSPSTFSGSLISRRRARLAHPPPYHNRNFINPRPPAFIPKPPPPPPLSPPPFPTPHADVFYRPPSH